MKALVLLVVAVLAACGSSSSKVQGTWDCKDGSKITWTADSWTRAGVTHKGAIDFSEQRTSCFG